MAVTFQVMVMDAEELRKASLRAQIKVYQEQAYRALVKRFDAPPFSQAQRAAEKDYMFAMGSLGRLEDLLGENHA